VHRKQFLSVGLTFAKLVKVLDLNPELLLLLVVDVVVRGFRLSDKGHS
jgi:hypothetical protein